MKGERRSAPSYLAPPMRFAPGWKGEFGIKDDSSSRSGRSSPSAQSTHFCAWSNPDVVAADRFSGHGCTMLSSVNTFAFDTVRPGSRIASSISISEAQKLNPNKDVERGKVRFGRLR